MTELVLALNHCPSNKAPGPDGFSMGFFKQMWEVVKSYIFTSVVRFFREGLLPPGLNSSFIALVPKIEGACKVTDFRPISLLNSCMKLITKILALRLGRVMHNLVSSTQSGFIKGRQSGDSILIASEVIQSLKAKSTRGLVLKLDFEKAFDTISWDFWFSLLKKFNFDDRWVSWIHIILQSTKTSVLVNGTI